MTKFRRRPGGTKRTTRYREVLLQTAELFTDRVFLIALLFSLSVHGALFLVWELFPQEQERGRRKVMIARLLGPSGRAPVPDGLEKPSSPPSPGGEGETDSPPPDAPSQEAPDGRRPDGAEEDGAGDDGTGTEAPPADVSPPVVPDTGTSGGEGDDRESDSSPSSEERSAGDSGRAGAGRGAGGSEIPGDINRQVPSPAGMAETAAAPDYGAVIAEIARRIDAAKFYPRLARRNGWEGKVLVELQVRGDGSLEGVKVVSPSAYRLLDDATLKAVRRAEPYPPLDGTVRVPVTYRLEE